MKNFCLSDFQQFRVKKKLIFYWPNPQDENFR